MRNTCLRFDGLLSKSHKVVFKKNEFFKQYTKSEASDHFFGVVAQLEEHLPCTQGVVSSNLIDSTNLWKNRLLTRLCYRGLAV